MEQHDDHVWLTVNGEAWAIHRIVRRPGELIFDLWRGYAPDLEFQKVQIEQPDWERYCAAAVALLRTAGTPPRSPPRP